MKKSDIAIVVICFALMIWWMTFRTPPPQPQAPPDPEQAEVQPLPPDGPPAVPPELAPAVPPPPTDAAAAAIAAEYAALEPAAPVTLRLGDLAEYVIDPEAGGIVRAVLLKHLEEDRENPMTLPSAVAPVGALRPQGRAAPVWTFSHAKVERDGDRAVTVTRHVLGTPLLLEQRWESTNPESYEYSYRAVVRNVGGTPFDLPALALNAGVMDPLPTPKGMFRAAGADQGADVMRGGRRAPKMYQINSIRKKLDRGDTLEWAEAQVHWLAVQNKYFTSVIVPAAPWGGCGFLLEPIKAGDEEAAKDDARHLIGFLTVPAERLLPGTELELEATCYLGAKRYDLLREFGHGVVSIMRFDLFILWHFSWMRWISLGIFRSMLGLVGIFRNYGVAIIIITLVLRLAFWPLTHRSTLLSRKMQAIKPEMEKLKEKYGDDPQKLQQKQWALYKEHKINPLGGCLPVLLQIPVFFAFFNVLRSAIELRHASFLWVADLSQPDTIATILGLPINPLAVAMGAAMVLQQRAMPTSADPAQQKMMMLMSGFFVILLYTMPSGLTLYWTINNICSIIQSRATFKLMDKPLESQGSNEAPREPRPGKAKKG